MVLSMILYKEDWDKYPDAIADVETSNDSFIHLCATYKAMGIENWAFPLALHDPSLQGVDPFDPDISDDLKLKIRVESKYNPWYNYRELLRIKQEGSSIATQFLANRGNIAMAWAYFNHFDFYLIQPRQTGKTVSVAWTWGQILYLLYEGTKIQLITEKTKLVKDVINGIRNMRDSLPKWLNPTDPKVDADNLERIECRARDTRFSTAVGRNTTEGAESVGRGATSGTLHGDEVPYVPKGEICFPVALGSTLGARRLSEKNGGLYGNVFTTTAGKLNTPNGAFAYKMFMDGYKWNESLFDCANAEVAKDVILTNSKSDIAQISAAFSYRMLGYDDQWFREAAAITRGSRDSIERDLLNIWSHGSSDGPIPVAVSEAINTSVREPNWVQITKNKYSINWYKDRDAVIDSLMNGHHLLTLDTGNAVGLDSNALIIMDVTDASILGISDVNVGSIFKYADWIAELLIRFPKTTLVIENKMSGQSVIDIIVVRLIEAKIDPCRRIFNRVIDDEHGNAELFADMKAPWSRRSGRFYDRFKKFMGFCTGAANRTHLYDAVLTRATETTGHRVTDRGLADQLLGLVKKNDRVDHIAGGHDDLVISWLLGHWFLNHAVNHSMYGIPVGKALSGVKEHGATLSDAELAIQDAQSKVRAELLYIKVQLTQRNTPLVNVRLRKKAQALTRLTEEDGGETVTMDSIIGGGKSKRRKARV